MQLKISNLTKIYPNGVKAIDHINLKIGKGMFGLLGPNGAGKSSLMRTIASLQSPDTGSIHFNEINVLKQPMQLRRILGYLPQEFGVYPKVSGEKLLHYFATLKGIESKKERKKIVAEVLEITNLSSAKKKAVSTYSGGMKQRFGIAQILLNRPQLIIVDEPTAGLDPAERQRFLNILREIGTENTIIFSTHIVDDVKDLCKALAIMDGGRVLLHENTQSCTEKLQGKVWIKKIERAQLESYEASYQVLSSSYNPDNSITVRVYANIAPDSDFKPGASSLEDVYFHTLQTA